VNSDTRADRFENRLLTAILDDFTTLAAESGAEGRRVSPGRASAGKPRKRGGLALLSGTVAVGAAAAGAVVVAGGGGHAVVPGHAASPARLSAYYMASQVKAAMKSSASGDLQYNLQRAPNSQTGVIENSATWSRDSAGQEITLSQVLGADGKPASGVLMTTTANKTVAITINYLNRTWSTATYPWGYTTPPNTPGPKPETTVQAADVLRNSIRAGSVTDAGTTDVDGQQAIHLVQGSAKAGELDMWVNPATYLPIRTIATAPGESVTSDRAIQDDYQWLPGTAANLRVLTPAGAIPAGFTQVSNAQTVSGS
jgi:hypothetical protein